MTAIRVVLGVLLSLTPLNPLRAQDRVSFQVATIEESGRSRRTLAQTLIDGPPGTDFEIILDTPPFLLTAHFVTDLVGENDLRVRADLHTRRLYGTSERGLPLYEEDRQRQILELSFDERLVLLPFGEGDGERLKIEITPARSSRSPTLPWGAPRPIEIDLEQPSPAGVVRVRAHKIPHDFTIQAQLRDGDRIVSQGKGDVRIGEEGTVLLRPRSESAGPPLALEIVVDDYSRAGPAAEFHFNVKGPKGSELASNWAGVTRLGNQTRYRLETMDGRGESRAYELWITVNTTPSP